MDVFWYTVFSMQYLIVYIHMPIIHHAVGFLNAKVCYIQCE